MASVVEHYEQHLAPVYSWMIGDFDAALDRSREEVSALGLQPGATGTAVDLGAGPGLHAIPLAERGFSVLAIDSSAHLVAELRERASGLPVRAVEDDLIGFRQHFDGPADAILCMGDTLTHLPASGVVEVLLGDVAATLATDGTFVATFRDYATTVPEGTGRFVPVRSDQDRILTCFLEYGPETVTVHDMLYERDGADWQFRVSSYPKLRLDPTWVADTLTAYGLAVTHEMGASGMVRIVARNG